MKTEVKLQVRRFPVRIQDMRTGEEAQDTITLDKPRLQAAQMVGQSSKELICRLYNRQGYRVLEIGTAERRELRIDLAEAVERDTE